jgi:hypothetical protein
LDSTEKKIYYNNKKDKEPMSDKDTDENQFPHLLLPSIYNHYLNQRSRIRTCFKCSSTIKTFPALLGTRSVFKTVSQDFFKVEVLRLCVHLINYRPTHLRISSLYIYKSVRFLVSFVACVVGFLVSLVAARFVLHVISFSQECGRCSTPSH